VLCKIATGKVIPANEDCRRQPEIDFASSAAPEVFRSSPVGQSALRKMSATIGPAGAHDDPSGSGDYHPTLK